jgi:hypothetical protein
LAFFFEQLPFASAGWLVCVPPGGASRADFKSTYGRNFGVRLHTQINRVSASIMSCFGSENGKIFTIFNQ